VKANFSEAFNSFRGYLEEAVPELGNIITHWENPSMFYKNSGILLPDAHKESGGIVTFSVVLWAATVEKSADTIAQV